MSKVLITRSKLDNLANIVSGKSGEPLPLTIDQMTSALEGMGSVDTSGDTVDEEHLLEGYTAHGADGAQIVGSYTPPLPLLQAKSATPSESAQTVTPDSGYDGLSSVSVNAIPPEYVIPSGTKSITSNGTIDVSGYASASVNVPSDTVTLQAKSATPTESQQTVTPDSGYDGLSSVVVGAISTTYVGSGIEQRDSSDLTASGATVSVPAGYYADAASKTIAGGTASTPATTVTANPTISVSDSGLITATASARKSVTPTVSAGYVSSGTAGTIAVSGSDTSQLTTQAAKTVTPTESTQTAVAAGRYTTGEVTVGAISSTYVGSGVTQRSATDLTASGATVTVPAGYYSAQASKAVASGSAGTPTATKGTVSNHAVSVTPSVTNTTGYITGGTKTGTAVTVSASELVSGSETKTANGTYDVTNLASVTVDIDFVTYYTSSSNPTSSQGSNGDIWLVTE